MTSARPWSFGHSFMPSCLRAGSAPTPLPSWTHGGVLQAAFLEEAPRPWHTEWPRLGGVAFFQNGLGTSYRHHGKPDQAGSPGAEVPHRGLVRSPSREVSLQRHSTEGGQEGAAQRGGLFSWKNAQLIKVGGTLVRGWGEGGKADPRRPRALP